MRTFTSFLLLAISISVLSQAANEVAVIDSGGYYYQYSESQHVPWSGELVNPMTEKQFLEYLITQEIDNPQVSFVLNRDKTDEIGFQHLRYQQYFKGIKVEHGVLNLHLQNGVVESFNGEIYTQFDEVTSGAISLDNLSAIAHYDFHEYLETVYALGEDNRLKKSYRIEAGNHQPEILHNLYLNVYNGSVVRLDPLLIHSDSTGSAVTHYRDTQTIVADFISQDSFRLRQTNHPISVFHTSQGTDIMDRDNNWNDSNIAIAGDVMYGTTLVGEFLKNEFKWDSYDDNGSTMTEILNFTASGNATWNLSGNFATYFVNSTSTVGPCASVDVVGHEMGHGIADENAGLVYTGESCMLHESFADIVGTLIEREADSTNWDWILGDQVWNNGIRDMSDPWNKNMPKYYNGQYWGRGCHSPGSVQNYWFYLIHHGDTGKNEKGVNFSIEGLGQDDAIQATFRSMFYYVTPNTEYKDIVKHTLKSAKDLFGTCSDKYTMVYDAWKIVGLEDTTMRGVDTSHGIIGKPLNCTKTPVTIPLASTGDAARVVTWYFPNGDSAIAQDTQIIINKTGTYQVISKTRVCKFTFKDTAMFVVQHKPEAKFSVPANDHCIHPTDSFSATNQTSNTDPNHALKYEWRINPSTIIENSYHFTAAKNIAYNYEMILKAYYEEGCANEATEKITMNPTPIPSFEANNGCLNEGVKINNTSINQKNLSFLWKFPDGSTSLKQSPDFIPTLAGIRTIDLIATHNVSGCVDSVSGTFEAYGLPNADFSHSDACYGEPITFVDQSTYDNDKAWNEWDFGIYKPFNKDTVEFTPSQSGEVQVGLKISDKLGCENSVYKSIDVETLEAQFNLQPKACTGDSLILTHTSKGDIDSVKWHINNTVWSKLDSTNWKPLQSGSYSVKLEVRNARCTNSFTRKIRFEPSPEAQFKLPEGCSGNPVVISSLGSQMHNAQPKWEFANNEVADGVSLTIEEMTDQKLSMPIRLTVTNKFGCSSDTSGTLIIHPLPICGFTTEHAGKANRVVFKANNSGYATYQWRFGDGSTGTGDSVEYTYDSDNRKIAALTITSEFGCVCSDSMPVNPLSLSVYNKTKSTIAIYPNPSKGSFRLKGVNGQVGLTIYDSKGAIVFEYEGEQSELTPSLTKGIYWVIVRNRGVESQHRFTIQ